MGSNKRKKATHKVRSKSGKTAAKTRTGMIHDFMGMLAGKTNEAAARGWAGLVKMDDN